MLMRGQQSAFEVPCFTDRALLDTFDSLNATRLGRTPMGAAYYARGAPGLGKTVTTIPRDLYLITVMLTAVAPSEMWCDGRSFERAHIPAGGVAILDHRRAWSTILDDPFELFDLYVPVSAISEAAEELGHSDLETLHCPLSESHVDPVVHQLALALLPIVRGRIPATLMFVEHVFEALAAHLACLYGGFRVRERPTRGGLTPSQMRRVTDMMMADFAAEPTLAELAASCGISTRHFIRAFKATAGEPPHRWLLKRKVARAKALLGMQVSISQIALSCGFADQSHFTRVFRRATGMSPALWRRSRSFA
jgi:AraC-like DNA-binding protein